MYFAIYSCSWIFFFLLIHLLSFSILSLVFFFSVLLSNGVISEFYFFPSISKLENETSFCKFGSKLPLKMKKLNMKIRCSSAQRDIEVKMTRKVEDTSDIIIADDDAEEDNFFDSFIEGVVKNLYLPEHSNVIKYEHWKHLAYCSWLILFPVPTYLTFDPEEKKIEEWFFYEFINDDEQSSKIILMEKHFSYTLDDKEIETMKYYDAIEKKKQKLKEKNEDVQGNKQ